MGYVDLIEKPVKANIRMEEVFSQLQRDILEHTGDGEGQKFGRSTGWSQGITDKCGHFYKVLNHQNK